jgi:hypothetical protein
MVAISASVHPAMASRVTPAAAHGRFREPQIERREHQDNSDVHYQPLPEPVPEEQDVHADHDGYQREHVKHDGCLSSHPSFLLRAAELEPERRYRLPR